MFSSYIPLSLEFSCPFLTVLSHLLLQWVEEPTLLVTRFEYANLFHTITDWYSAYVSSRVTNLPNRPNVIFVDGHCKVCDALCILLLVQFILFVA
jgi:prepilin-type processing-associated H-X9-DG protein